MLSLLLLLFSIPAFACEKQELHISHERIASPDSTPVSVQFSLEGSLLRARFEVRNPMIYAPAKLKAGQYPFMFDVLELFLSVNGIFPYYEIELSPNNETFLVKVLDLKQPFQEGIKLELTHVVQRTATGWTADLEIPLEQLGWTGDPAKIVGNAYAIQGEKPNRRYYSLFLPVQAKPNFHLPQYFRPLLYCDN